MARAIDASHFGEIMEQWKKDCLECDDQHGADVILDVILQLDDMPTLTQPPITGNTSDGYHTFNELYHHRAVLFSVICNDRPEVAWKSKRHHDGTMYDGMFIVGIDTPEGQATYHYDIDPYWDMFHVKELELAPEWDGHTPGEAIRRIGTLTQPNEPLTLEELSLCNDPVWVKRLAGEDLSGDGWAIVEGPRCLTWRNGIPVSWGIRVWWPGSEVEDYPKYEDYGKTWLAYRRPLEEVLRDGKEQ